jgi:hypothetical protein
MLNQNQSGNNVHVAVEGSAGASAIYSDTGDGKFRQYSGGSLNDGTQDKNPHAYVAVFDGANSVFNVDGTEYTGDPGSRDVSSGGYFTVGAVDPSQSIGHTNAYHGEVVFTPERLDSTQRDNEIARLKNEWGIA